MNGMVSLLIVSLGVLVACSPSPESVSKVLRENPDILQTAIEEQIADKPDVFLSLIEQHPEAFMAALGKASQEQKRVVRQRQLDESFSNPKKPAITPDRIIFGNPQAAVTIVEYSDFECAYCARVAPTVARVMSEYGDQIRLIYKHLPLDFHSLAMPAAQYFEAIGLQDPAKAKAFHDTLFEDREAFIQGGEAFLKKTAEELGIDMKQLAHDVQSEQVAQRIAADIDEAGSLGFRGTPGFLINGVPLSGAKPYAAFEAIIDRHLAGS